MAHKKGFFSFYDVVVEVTTSSPELYERLISDFSYFVQGNLTPSKIDIKLQADLSSPTIHHLLKEKCIFSRKEMKVFEKENIRLIDYGNGRARSCFNFLMNTNLIQSEELDLLHEKSYLFILSRVGKLLDLKGFHRLHGMCLLHIKQETLVISLMSSGGGKTTLFSHLLNTNQFSIYSDDSPLISNKGEVLPFPVRVGFEKNGILPEEWKDIPFKLLKREEYGEKKLISISSLNWPVGGQYKKVIIFSGKRGKEFKIESGNKFIVIPHILREGVIGIGLPILIEYFWERGFRDFIRKTKITFKRIKSFWLLLRKSEVKVMTLGENPRVNSIELEKYLSK